MSAVSATASAADALTAVTGSAVSAVSIRRAVADGWLELLGRHSFDWFCTFTFRESVHPEAAAKRFGVFVDRLNRHLYGKRWKKHPSGGVYWCRALELQRRGVIHYHALIGDVVNLNFRARRLDYMDLWNELAGFARIEEARSRNAVNAYCAKYVTKDGELDVSDNLGRALGQQQALVLGRR